MKEEKQKRKKVKREKKNTQCVVKWLELGAPEMLLRDAGAKGWDRVWDWMETQESYHRETHIKN